MKRVIVSCCLLVFTFIAWPSVAQIEVSVSFGPPPLPVYVQPPCPDDGYLWTPGYWAYDNYFGYYWVPGTWVLAPQPGLLWTPGWWGWNENAFLFHEGYWAPHVGFYGGINYGFGFFGDGYAGGRWDGNHFFYNRAVSNVNVTNIHNVYNTTVVNNVTVNHVSYNGRGGVEARPTREQEEIAQQHHVAMPAAQLRHLQMARANPQLRAEANHGKPSIAATARPAAFTGPHVVAARQAGGAYQAPERKLDHASSVPAHQAPAPLHAAKSMQQESHEGGSESQMHQQQGRQPQQERQQQQERMLVERQNQQHAQLQAQQEREHQQAQQKNLSEQRQQEMERQHAQQTAQLEQHHMQQMQHVERSQVPSRPSEPARPGPHPSKH